MAAISCADWLRLYYSEVSPHTFYRDLFPLGELDKRGAMTKGKYCGIAVQIEGKKAKRYTITDELDNIDDLVGSDVFTIISPLSYAGKTQKSDMARYCYALAVDLDNIVYYNDEPQGLIDLFSQIERAKILPCPTYIVTSSFNNLHLYYMLDKPIPLHKDNKLALSRYKTVLTDKLWNYYTTNDYQSTQQEPIGQGMRAVGSISKNGSDRVTAFLTGERVSVEYLNKFVRNDTEKIIIKSYKKSDKTDKAEQKPKRIPNNGFYEWYKNSFMEYAKEGKRYFCLMVLAIAARKSYVPYERLEEDALSFVPELDLLTTREDNHFDEYDALKAISVYYNDRFITMRRETLVRLSGVPMTPNKRNGLKQSVHLQIARSTKQIRNANGVGNANNAGRKPKRDEIRAYAAEHPDANHSQIARALGVSRPTVIKWLRD